MINVMIRNAKGSHAEYNFIANDSNSALQRAIEHYITDELNGFNSSIFPVSEELWVNKIKKAVADVEEITVRDKIDLLNSICRSSVLKITKVFVNYSIEYPSQDSNFKTTDNFLYTYEYSGGNAKLKITGYEGTSSVINIPNTVKIIDSDAFLDKTFIEEIFIGQGVETFGINSFDGCSNLKTLYYNATNCTTILAAEGHDARTPFTGCGKDIGGFDIIVGENVEVLPANIFKPFISSDGTDYVPAYIKSITILNKDIKIDENAFEDHREQFTINYVGNVDEWTATGGTGAMQNAANEGNNITLVCNYNYV